MVSAQISSSTGTIHAHMYGLPPAPLTKWRTIIVAVSYARHGRLEVRGERQSIG